MDDTRQRSGGGRQTKADQLRDYVLDLIERDLKPHDRLPTERELAELMDVSRLTARHALARLESEGRIYREQGSGTYVSEPRIAKSLELTSFSEDMRSRGLHPGSRLLLAETVPAGPDIGLALDISPREDVVHIRRARTADSAPMCIEDTYFPARLVPGLLDENLTGSLYELLDRRFHARIVRADQAIRVTVIDRDQSALLGIPEFSPAFDVWRTGMDARGRRWEHARSVYRGDRYSYDLTIYR